MNGYKSSLEFWTATRFLTISLVTLHVDKIDERYRHFCRSSLLSRSLDLNSVKTGFCPIFIIEYKNDLEFWNSSFDNPSGYVAREQDRWKISPSSSLSRSILFRFCFNFSSNQHRVVYRALEFRTATRPLVTLHNTRSMKDIAISVDLPSFHANSLSILWKVLLLQFSSNKKVVYKNDWI